MEMVDKPPLLKIEPATNGFIVYEIDPLSYEGTMGKRYVFDSLEGLVSFLKDSYSCPEIPDTKTDPKVNSWAVDSPVYGGGS